MKAAVHFLRATHLEPSLAITAATTVLAISAGLGGRAAWVAMSVLCGQFSLGWANDYIDRERDRAAGRLSKPLAAGRVPSAAVRLAAIVALPAALLLSFPLGRLPVALHGAGLACGHLHNLYFKWSRLSPLPFALGFAAIPSYIDTAATGRWAAWTVTVGAACLGTGIHFVNALRDVEADRSLGVKGLPERLANGLSTVFATVSLAAAALLVALPCLHRMPVLVAWLLAWLLVASVAAASAAGRRWLAYRLMIAAAGAAVLTLLLTGP